MESSKTKYLAVPLLRGLSDSITRGDLVMYTILGGKYFYLGPVNTNNTPSNSADHTYNPKKGNRFFNKDLRAATEIRQWPIFKSSGAYISE